MAVRKYSISVVVPVYNEEKNILPFYQRTIAVMKQLKCNYEIIFSLDPCTDGTEDVILDLRKTDKSVKLLKFSRRFGQPAATLAGIHYSTSDACVVIDVDLQDPPELIIDMVEKWQEGYHVAYAQRISRKGETIIKKIVSAVGYWVINKISDVKIPRNTGDFRLMSREVVEKLKELKESHGFLRGLVGLVGFSQVAIPYERDARFAGDTNYNRFLGSLTIGFNGIVSFSRYPLQIISLVGFIISIFSFLIGTTYVVLRLFHVEVLWGNPTTVILISFLSGIQLLSMGVMGEYLGRIYDEVKQRPLYFVQDAHGFSPARGKHK